MIQPTLQADSGPKTVGLVLRVDSRLALFYIHQINHVNSHNNSSITTATLLLLLYSLVNRGSSVLTNFPKLFNVQVWVALWSFSSCGFYSLNFIDWWLTANQWQGIQARTASLRTAQSTAQQRYYIQTATKRALRQVLISRHGRQSL